MVNQRKPIGKKLRFEIFKRDKFKCQYCGSVPPNTVLEIDHITPVVMGGKNSIDNLLTACFDCNRGKGKHELDTLPESTADKSNLLKEKLSQYKEFVKLQEGIENLVNSDIESVADIFSDFFEDRELTISFKQSSLKKFISLLGVSEVRHAMYVACSKVNYNSGHCVKYFCGICWGKIKDQI